MSLGGEELSLLVRVVPLAIGAAFTPSLFAIQVLTTAGPHWVSRSLAVALGSASAFFIACSLLFFGFTQLPHHQASEPNPVGGVIWMLAAAVLLGAAIWLFWPHLQLAQAVEKNLTQKIERARWYTFFGVAFALSIKDITSFALIVPALHETASSGLGFLFQLGTCLIVFALALFPVLLPPLWRALRGKAANRDLGAIYRVTMDHQFSIVGVIATLFCLYCLAMSLGPYGFGVYGIG